MAIRSVNYTAFPDDIYPKTEQYGGIQGEHKVTKITVKLDDTLVSALSRYNTGGLKYRFEVYDGAGGCHPTLSEVIDTPGLSTVAFEKYLEQNETAAGGTLKIYLIISQTVTSGTDESTELILYTSPITLYLDPLPNGMEQTYKTATDLNLLIENTKNAADNAERAADDAMTAGIHAADAADTANAAAQRVTFLENGLKTKVNNGDFNGVGVKSTKVENGNLYITLDNETVINAGNVKGDKGDNGEKGDKGDKGNTYLLTDIDKTDIANLVLNKFVNGDEVRY